MKWGEAFGLTQLLCICGRALSAGAAPIDKKAVKKTWRIITVTRRALMKPFLVEVKQKFCAIRDIYSRFYGAYIVLEHVHQKRFPITSGSSEPRVMKKTHVAEAIPWSESEQRGTSLVCPSCFESRKGAARFRFSPIWTVNAGVIKGEIAPEEIGSSVCGRTRAIQRL